MPRFFIRNLDLNVKIKLKHLLVIGLALVTSLSFAARDPQDVEDTEEHPEVARFPGFYIDNSKHNDYNEATFPSAKGDIQKAGKYWYVDYILKDGKRKPSPVELLRNYENAFKKSGGAMVFRDQSSVAVYRMPLGSGSERWTRINVDGEGERYQLEIVDLGGMQQKVEFSADQMADELRNHGFIALTGILFDTGKASIRPESEPLLDEVVALLKKDTALKLSIEGHTDSVGDKKTNLDLSKKRAESVVAYVGKAGIDPRRLKADGKGDTVPVGDNRTEAGRAKNRRVELVKF